MLRHLLVLLYPATSKCTWRTIWNICHTVAWTHLVSSFILQWRDVYGSLYKTNSMCPTIPKPSAWFGIKTRTGSIKNAHDSLMQYTTTSHYTYRTSYCCCPTIPVKTQITVSCEIWTRNSAIADKPRKPCYSSTSVARVWRYKNLIITIIIITRLEVS